MKLYLYIFVSLFCISFVHAQTNRLNDLLNDIQNSKILGNHIDRNYYSNASIKGFNSYIFIPKSLNSDTVESVALLKDSSIIGILTACHSCSSYSSIKITSENFLFPSLALSTKRNGKIDRASYKTKNNYSVTVGDINYDKRIDFASYYIGNGLYSVLLLAHKLDSITGYLIYNSFNQEYIGILTFKGSEHYNTFDKCFIKVSGNWDSYSFASTKKPLFIESKNELQILKMEFPDMIDFEYETYNNELDSSMRITQGIKLIELMKSSYLTTKGKWLNDYKTIANSKAIGLSLPKLIILNSTSSQIKASPLKHKK